MSQLGIGEQSWSSVPWLAIIGADKSRESAQDELKSVSKSGFKPILLRRQGWYRTAALFDSRQQAEEAVSTLSKKIRPGYVRSLSARCGPVKDLTGSFVECSH